MSDDLKPLVNKLEKLFRETLVEPVADPLCSNCDGSGKVTSGSDDGLTVGCACLTHAQGRHLASKSRLQNLLLNNAARIIRALKA